MKTNKRLLTAVVAMCIFTAAFAQQHPFVAEQHPGSLQHHSSDDYLLQWKGKNKEHTLGGYIELNGDYASIRNEPSGFLGAKYVAVIDKHWGIGVAQKALWHDYDLNSLVSDGTYQLQAGYSGCYVEYLLPVGQNLRFSLSLTSGYGLAKYEYKKEFQSAHTWYERVIDQDVFHINEPAVEVMCRLVENWWLGAHVSYRNIGNLNLMATDPEVLTGFSSGISIKYGLF